MVLVNFGTFTVRARTACTGRNPQTGAPIELLASKATVFFPGKALKAAVNGTLRAMRVTR